MLEPSYRYIAFDFETTGLDTKKDEPIQIGIVMFDHAFRVQDTYTSLIQPRKNIKELKDIVRFVTGFKLEDLEHAPYMEDILIDIAPFFNERTVVVGHNIGFDIAILQKYLPRTPAYSVDTYTLSKALFHFKASYALDVLDKELHAGQDVSPTTNHHDALIDSYAGMRLFQSCIEKITTLRHKHILLDYVLQESQETLRALIQKTDKPFKFSEKQLFLPPLKTGSTTNKKVVMKNKQPLHFSKDTYVGTAGLRSLIQQGDWSHQAYILSFTHKSKVHLAQRYFEENGYTTGTLHDGIIFNPEHVNLFLQKKVFTDEEVLFVSKYYSQYDAGHTIMDINSASDYKIFGALTTRQTKKQQKIRLCTHEQLFQMSDKIEPHDTILFFDKERWYQNYSKWMKQAFDPMHRIQLIEHIQYKELILQNTASTRMYETYKDQCTLFVGILGAEIDKLYINYTQAKMEIDGILDNPRFPKTQALFIQIEEQTNKVLAEAHDHDKQLLEQQRKKLSTYLHHPCEVEKKMYHGDQRYYLLHQQALYLSYEDFLDQLPRANYHFLSNSNTAYPSLLTQNTTPSIAMDTTTDADKLCKKISTITGDQFIISSSKQASQELFKKMLATGYTTHYTIVAENITGGIGKNLYNARTSDKPTIFIGGYNFYLASLVEKFDFAHIHLYHIQGAMKQQIVHDLWRYSQ